MAQDPDEAMRVGQFWATVSEEHNVEKFATILADDFTMWYNFDPVERSKQEFMETLRAAHTIFHNQVNADCRITPTAEGFVLQATLQGDMEGHKVNSPYCFVAQMRDGLVVRGWEYFDTGKLPKHAGAVGEGMV